MTFGDGCTGYLRQTEIILAVYRDDRPGPAHGDFRLAVERERALGQLDDIVAHYEAFRHHEGPAGPGATQLRREFARVQDELAQSRDATIIPLRRSARDGSG